MHTGAEVYHSLTNVMKKKYEKGATDVGNEGRFAPHILENIGALELLEKNIIGKTRYPDQVVICMGVAASEFFRFQQV